MQLFIIEKPPHLAKQEDPTSIKALADQDEVSIGQFDQIMMDNCNFEKLVNREMIER